MAGRLVVLGVPVAQGSKNAFYDKKAKRCRIVDVNPKGLTAWRRAVNEAAKAWRERKGGDPFDGPVVLSMTFTLARPPSATREWPHVAPDLDKLVRAVLDALTKVLYSDDSRVVAVLACKRYGTPSGVVIDFAAARDFASLKVPPTIGQLAASSQEDSHA